MRTLKYLFAALIFILVVGYLVGLFLPSKTRVEKTIEINRSTETVYKVINSMGDFNQWSPWKIENPNVTYQVSEPSSGVGSTITWSGKENVEKGSLKITKNAVNSSVEQELIFGKSNNHAASKMELTSLTETITKVSWVLELDAGKSVLKRYSGLVADDILVPDLSKGLNKLKEYVESLPMYDYSNISLVNLEEKTTYAKKIDSSVEGGQVASEIGSAYKSIMDYLAETENPLSGAPIVITEILEGQSYNLTAALPVLVYSNVEPQQPIFKHVLPSGKAVQIIHRGSYDDLPETYKVLNAYLYQNQLKPRSDAWEEYISDPGDTAEKDLITHIILPLQ